MTKKTIIAAAVLLLAAVLFVGAGAADAAPTMVPEGELANAVAAATDGAELQLIGNQVLTEPLVLNMNITIDLNGHTISPSATWTTTANDKDSLIVVYRVAQGDPGVVIKNGTIDAGNGNNDTFSTAIKMTSAQDTVKNAAANTNPAKLKLQNVIVTIDCKNSGSDGYAISGNGTTAPAEKDRSNTEIVIDGGKLISKKVSAIYQPQTGLLTIQHGAEITGTTGIYAKAGNITIDASTVKGTGVYAEPVPYGNGCYSTGDAIIMDAKEGYAGDIELTISGDSKVESTNGYAVQECSTDQVDETAVVSLTLAGEFKGGKDGLKTTDTFRTKATQPESEVTADFNGAIIHQYKQDLIPSGTGITPPTIEPFAPGNKSGEVEVTSTQSLEYDLIIPPNVDLTYGVEKSGIVNVTLTTKEAGDPPTKQVEVTMSTATNYWDEDDHFVLKTTGGQSAKYIIKNGDSEVTSQSFKILTLLGNAESGEKTTTLKFNLPTKITTAGEYKAVLTFQGAVVPYVA